MRIGLLADIHGDTKNLSRAIDCFHECEIDRLILLGDIICDASHADETVAILQGRDLVGVWGNHELGLCVDPEEEVVRQYSASVRRFFGTLRSGHVLGDMYFSHTFPTEDATDVLSYYVGRPDEDSRFVENCFKTLPHRIMACGHFHRWFAATPAGQLAWDGVQTLKLDLSERYFLIIGAVMMGFAAILDDRESVLIPIRL